MFLLSDFYIHVKIQKFRKSYRLSCFMLSLTFVNSLLKKNIAGHSLIIFLNLDSSFESEVMNIQYNVQLILMRNC